jgi:hypothetical protein
VRKRRVEEEPAKLNPKRRAEIEKLLE